MGEKLGFYTKKVMMDEKTGEVLYERMWKGYDGFTDKGYKYRARGCFIRYYFDSLPYNYDKETLMLLFMIAELMNTDNVLVRAVKRRSKFSNIRYEAYTKDEVHDMVRYKYGINKFDRCWKELKDSEAIKEIKYHDVYVWAVNPSIVSKCRAIPYWLYEEFQESIDIHLTPFAIKRMKAAINEFYEDDPNKYDYDVLGLQ